MLACPQVKVSVVVGAGRPELFPFEFTNVVSGPPGPRGPATVLSVHMSGSTRRRGNCKAGMVVLETPVNPPVSCMLVFAVEMRNTSD